MHVLPLVFLAWLQIGLFVVGAGSLTPVISIVLVASTLPLGFVPFPSLWILQIAVLFFQLRGLWRLSRASWPALQGIIARHYRSILLTLACLGIWSWWLRDLDGLGSFHDGIGHSVYFLRIVESGQPLLHRNLVSLSTEFGEGHFRFYPGGVHALLAAFGGWMLWIPGVTAAAVLKAWLLAITALVPALAIFIALSLFELWDPQGRILDPRKRFRYALIVGIAALTYWRYPASLLPSGGFSRQAALVVVLPLLLALLRGSLPPRVPLLVCFLGPVATFLLHPSTFVLLLLTLAWIWLTHGRWNLREEGAQVAATLVGIAVAYALVRTTASDAHFIEAIPGVADATVWVQLHRVLQLIPSVFDDFSHSAVAPVSGRELLDYLGVAAIVLWLRSRSVPLRIAGYPLFLLAGFALLFLFSLVPLPFFQLIPQLFYNHPDRAAEQFYLAQVLLWTFGLCFLLEHRSRRLWRKLGMVLLVLLAVDTGKGVMAFSRQIERQLVRFRSPLRSDSGRWMDLIRRDTEPNAIIVAAPLEMDSIEFRTGRQTLFVYCECPYGNTGENCARREAYYKKLLAGEKLPTLGRPVYWFVDENLRKIE